MNVAQVDAGKSVEKVDRDQHGQVGESKSHHKHYRDFPFLLPSSFPASVATSRLGLVPVQSHRL